MVDQQSTIVVCSISFKNLSGPFSFVQGNLKLKYFLYTMNSKKQEAN